MNLRTLSLDFFFYGTLDFLRRGVGIILVPLYTRALSQADYGNLDILSLIGSVLCVLVDLQFTAGFSRLYYEYRDVGGDKRFVGTVIISRLVGGFVIAVLFILFGFLGAMDFGFIPSFSKNTCAWILVAGNVPLNLVSDVWLLQARMLRMKKWYALGTISNSLLACALCALFVVVWRMGIAGVLLGLLASNFISLLLLGCGLYNEMKPCFDIGPFKELMRYSMPLVPGWWLSFTSTYLCRFFVFSELGAVQNAILAVCMKVATVIALFFSSFQMAWEPLAMAHAGKVSGKDFYVRSMRLLIAGGVFSTLCVSAIVWPIFTFIVPDSYLAAKYYFPLFAVGYLLSGCASNLQVGNQVAKNTYWISINSLVCIAANAAILIVFSKSCGIIVAGIGWIVSFLLKNGIAYVAAQRSYYVPYDKKAFFLLGIVCALFLSLVFGNYSKLVPDWFFVGCVVSAGVVFPVLVMAPSERHAIRQFVAEKMMILS